MELLKLIITAVGLGFGLAMDAFSVSLANGLHEPKMKFPRVLMIAGTFAVFQGVMPLLGWVAVHTVLEYFSIVGKFIPWIAFAILGFIGGKMIIEGVRGECESGECEDRLTFGLLMVQGVATSIDALSVGFTISDYNVIQAVVCAVLIMAVTFGICFAGILIGKKFGTVLSSGSAIFGGSILIFIGLEIFITSFIK